MAKMRQPPHNPDTDPSAEPGVEPRDDPRDDPRTEEPTVLLERTDAEEQAEAGAKARAGIWADADAEGYADAGTDAEAETAADADADPDANANADADPDANADAETSAPAAPPPDPGTPWLDEITGSTGSTGSAGSAGNGAVTAVTALHDAVPYRAPVLPFAAFVGQPRLRAALLLLAVEPRLHGLLIRGDRGSGKTTAARGLADLLPPVGSPPAEQPAPFVTLPLGATEDQVVGSFELEAALRSGRRRLSPGLLARAHGGVLYVDEVNLLEDHLVDLLLDVAASGVNVVAREGLQTAHPARFLLVGTMNPEEGELRPQLTDRFGLCVSLEPLTDPHLRVDIVERALDFEQDPAGFTARYRSAQRTLRQRIVTARARLPSITVTRAQLEQAARLSVALQAAGHRADLLLVKAARALAALDERAAVTPEDLADAAELVFPHRLPLEPFDEEAVDPIARIRSAASETGLTGLTDSNATSGASGASDPTGASGASDPTGASGASDPTGAPEATGSIDATKKKSPRRTPPPDRSR